MKRLRTFRAPEVEGKWHLVDVKGMRVGRVSTQIASVLRGKHKPIYDPSCDHGDFVVVINADEVTSTSSDKVYQWHTGFPGGLKTETFEKRRARRSEQLIMLAVRRMLPKGPLGYRLLKKLKVYRGKDHPHEAQQPQALQIKE